MEAHQDFNEWRLSELMDRLTTHHYRHDYAVNMKGWDCVKRAHYEVHLDNSLLYVSKVRTMDFYPAGYFECGGCHKFRPLAHDQHAFFNYNQEYMICRDCNDKVKHTMVPAYPRMCARIFGEPELDASSEYVRMIDLEKTGHRANVQRNITIKRAQRIYDHNPGAGFIFLGGKSTLDLWHDVLARRVVAAFRRNAKRKLREKVAFVIAAVTNISAETAHGIAAGAI